MNDPLMALLQGGDTPSVDLEAIANQLRKQQQVGSLFSLSGDKVLSPIGGKLSSDVDDQAGTIGQMRASDAWRKAQMKMAEDNNAATMAWRMAQAAKQDARQDQMNSRFSKTQAWNFAKKLEDSGIASTAYPMKNLLDYMKDIPEGKLKGVGMFSTPEKELTEEGRYMRTLTQSVINPILLARSGAAVTDPEEKRLLRELGQGTISTEADFRKAMSLLSSSMGRQIGNLYGGIGGTDSEVAQMYIQGAGDGAITPNMFDVSPMGMGEEGVDWTQYGLSPEEIAEAQAQGLL